MPFGGLALLLWRQPKRLQMQQTYIWIANGAVLSGVIVAFCMAVLVHYIFPETWPYFEMEANADRVAIRFNTAGAFATFLIVLFSYLGWVSHFNKQMHNLAQINVQSRGFNHTNGSSET